MKKDRGFSWVVLFASFIDHVFSIGFSYSVLGVLTIHQMRYFDVSVSQSSLIGSVHLGVFLIGGKFVMQLEYSKIFSTLKE